MTDSLQSLHAVKHRDGSGLGATGDSDRCPTGVRQVSATGVRSCLLPVSVRCPCCVRSDDGLADIHIIIKAACVHLTADGWLLFEQGYDQAERCRELLLQAGFDHVQSWRDFVGIERVSGGRAPL